MPVGVTMDYNQRQAVQSTFEAKLEEAKKNGDKKAAATLKVVEYSNKKSKNKRIIAFDPKRKASIAKRKLSNHQLATAVEGENREALKGSALKINKKKMRVEHA